MRHLDDWLESYLKFTQNSESPVLYHLWSGIAAISSCLRRKCFSNWGLQGYVYPNMYIVLVGPPGGRKGTAMKIAKSMVVNLGVPTSSDALGSTQILYREIMDAEDEFHTKDGKVRKHKSLSIWSEEFQVFLSDKDQTLRAALTDLFDCPDKWNYSTLKRGQEDLSNCFLSIIGAITPSLLQDKLTMDAVGGGLLSRVILIVGYGPIKKIALPFLSKDDQQLQKDLAKDLEQINLLAGPFILSREYLSTYSKWYNNDSGADGIDSDKFLGYNSRRALQIKKLSMILSASENNEMMLQPHHFHKALHIIKETEQEMPNAFFGIGRGVHAEVLTSIMRYIESHRDFSFTDIQNRFALDALPRDLEQYLDILVSTNKVKKEMSPTQTRYKMIQEKIREFDNSYLEDTLYSKMLK